MLLNISGYLKLNGASLASRVSPGLDKSDWKSRNESVHSYSADWESSLPPLLPQYLFNSFPEFSVY